MEIDFGSNDMRHCTIGKIIITGNMSSFKLLSAHLTCDTGTYLSTLYADQFDCKFRDVRLLGNIPKTDSEQQVCMLKYIGMNSIVSIATPSRLEGNKIYIRKEGILRRDTVEVDSFMSKTINAKLKLLSGANMPTTINSGSFKSNNYSDIKRYTLNIMDDEDKLPYSKPRLFAIHRTYLICKNNMISGMNCERHNL